MGYSSSALDPSEKRLLLVAETLPEVGILRDAVDSSRCEIITVGAHMTLAQLHDAIETRYVFNSSTKFASVGIVDHGAPGAFFLLHDLGAVTMEALVGSVPLMTFFKWLGARAEQIDLLGCEVARGHAGETMLAALHQVAGIPITASTEPVGGNMADHESAVSTYFKMSKFHHWAHRLAEKNSAWIDVDWHKKYEEWKTKHQEHSKHLVDLQKHLSEKAPKSADEGELIKKFVQELPDYKGIFDDANELFKLSPFFLADFKVIATLGSVTKALSGWILKIPGLEDNKIATTLVDALNGCVDFFKPLVSLCAPVTFTSMGTTAVLDVAELGSYASVAWGGPGIAFGALELLKVVGVFTPSKEMWDSVSNTLGDITSSVAGGATLGGIIAGPLGVAIGGGIGSVVGGVWAAVDAINTMHARQQKKDYETAHKKYASQLASFQVKALMWTVHTLFKATKGRKIVVSKQYGSERSNIEDERITPPIKRQWGLLAPDVHHIDNFGWQDIPMAHIMGDISGSGLFRQGNVKFLSGRYLANITPGVYYKMPSDVKTGRRLDDVEWEGWGGQRRGRDAPPGDAAPESWQEVPQLTEGEDITQIDISSGTLIDGIRFYTNKNKNWMKWAGDYGANFATLHMKKLLGMTGTCGSYIDSIQFVYEIDEE